LNDSLPVEPFGRARSFLYRRKYECLLAALLQHLFIAVVLPNLSIYTRVLWPINMVLLGVFSIGIFRGRRPASRGLKNLMSVVVVFFPLVPIFFEAGPAVMITLSLSYVLFFVVIQIEVLRYLLRPSYINVDLVSASICGFFLLLEIGIFLMQALYYAVPGGFRGIDATSFTTIYLDFVYFCSVVVTSIGFGDIVPAHHITKLATSMLGIAGQMYAVVLIGILVSKYASAATRE